MGADQMQLMMENAQFYQQLLQCLMPPVSAGSVSSCAQSTLLISAMCSQCFGQFGVCVAQSCPTQCPVGTAPNDACLQCIEGKCSPQLVCSGLPSCAAGQLYCPAAGCVNPGNDAANCGGCGTTCPATGPTCCGGSCTNVTMDPNNCGACGTVCNAPEACGPGGCGLPIGAPCGTSAQCFSGDCSSGMCSCPSGLTPCDPVAPCVNVTTDNNNCGGCHHACMPNMTCVNATCLTCGHGGQMCCPGPVAFCSAGFTCLMASNMCQ